MMKQTHYEVIVVGGGFSGTAAAIAAAREGREVLLIEKYNSLGGAAVFDLVNPFMRYWTYSEGRKEKIMLSCGLFSEIVERLEAMGGFAENTNRTRFSEEHLKLLLNRMAAESGVKLLYQTYLCGAETEDGRITSITVSNVSGSTALTADCYIDATGDANLAMLAGFPYRVGRESDGLCQPMTLCFRVGDVDPDKFLEEKAEITPLYKKLQAEGKILNPREDVLVFRTLTPSVLHFNTTRVVKLDPTDAEDVTRAEIIAREQVFEMMAFLRDNFESFRNATLLSTGIQIGARESRMIDGEYVLTKDDLLSTRRFDDSIAVCNYDIDIHSPDGAGTSHYYFPDGTYYTIPYRCLVPKGAKNLLVTGRCVSADHDAQASLRIMPTCATLGEAAGVAAALS
ncbi:MAG: FAD-dependent oxidoreductase, partial [Clostridia bacterium]|nr:FAD-dependent oxidoreductase [Clostridia bacterium]